MRRESLVTDLRGSAQHVLVTKGGDGLPAVSVITPVFNAERYIGAAIESVLGQSASDWELLVIDDGSTDGTPDVVREYAGDPRLRVVRREHRGLSAARNEGVSKATGRLLAFLDADDLWRPEYLERMVSMLDRKPEAVLAFAGWRYVDGVGTVLPQFVEDRRRREWVNPAGNAWQLHDPQGLPVHAAA